MGAAPAALLTKSEEERREVHRGASREARRGRGALGGRAFERGAAQGAGGARGEARGCIGECGRRLRRRSSDDVGGGAGEVHRGASREARRGRGALGGRAFERGAAQGAGGARGEARAAASASQSTPRAPRPGRRRGARERPRGVEPRRPALSPSATSGAAVCRLVGRPPPRDEPRGGGAPPARLRRHRRVAVRLSSALQVQDAPRCRAAARRRRGDARDEAGEEKGHRRSRRRRPPPPITRARTAPWSARSCATPSRPSRRTRSNESTRKHGDASGRSRVRAFPGPRAHGQRRGSRTLVGDGPSRRFRRFQTKAAFIRRKRRKTDLRPRAVPETETTHRRRRRARRARARVLRQVPVPPRRLRGVHGLAVPRARARELELRTLAAARRTPPRTPGSASSRARCARRRRKRRARRRLRWARTARSPRKRRRERRRFSIRWRDSTRRPRTETETETSPTGTKKRLRLRVFASSKRS